MDIKDFKTGLLTRINFPSKTSSSSIVSFPNYKFSLEKLVSEGDIVTTRYNIITGSDNSTIISGVDMYRIARGKIVERWGSEICSILSTDS